MATCIFLSIRCAPGSTYEVADVLARKESHSEMYSTSGSFDLLLKMYVPDDQDVGRFVNEYIHSVDNIERTQTTLTFTAF